MAPQRKTGSFDIKPAVAKERILQSIRKGETVE